MYYETELGTAFYILHFYCNLNLFKIVSAIIKCKVVSLFQILC